MSNDPMTKTNTFHIRLCGHSPGEVQCFCYFNIIVFVIVSHFVLRISNFSKKTIVFNQAYKGFHDEYQYLDGRKDSPVP
jgi:hypothetical protein